MTRPIEFWQWVITRRAGENPRGDFIRDTRYAFSAGLDPETEFFQHACKEARDECAKLLRQWRRTRRAA